MSATLKRRKSLPWMAAYSGPAAILAIIAAFSGGTSEWMPVMVFLAALSVLILASYFLYVRLRRTIVRQADITIKGVQFLAYQRDLCPP